MFTQLLRTRPRVGYPLVLALLAVVTLIGVGGAVVAAVDRPGTAVFLAYLGAVGVLSIAAVVGEMLVRSRRPSARLARTASGEPSTYVGYGGSVLVGPVGALAASLAAGIAGAVLAQRAGSSGGLVIGGGVALASLIWLVPVLLGRVSPGGLHVTGTGLEYHRFGSGWRVAWEDVAGVVPREPLPIVLHPGASVVRERTSPYAWSGEVRAGDNLLGVSTRHLGVDEQALGFLLVTCLDRPDRRAQLGTAESLDWAVLREVPQIE